jgi:hypothetical protein
VCFEVASHLLENNLCFSGVLTVQVVLQIVLIAVGLLAKRALEITGSCVGFEVVFDVASLEEDFRTAFNLALVANTLSSRHLVLVHNQGVP